MTCESDARPSRAHIRGELDAEPRLSWLLRHRKHPRQRRPVHRGVDHHPHVAAQHNLDASCRARSALDEAAAEVAKLDAGDIVRWRTAIAGEPSVRA